MGKDDRSHPTLLARKWQLAKRIAAPDFLVGAQRGVFHEDHLVGAQMIELDGPGDISVQILDAHIDAAVLEAKLVRLLACPERSIRKPCFDLALAGQDVATKKVPPRRECLIATEVMVARPAVRQVRVASCKQIVRS